MATNEEKMYVLSTYHQALQAVKSKHQISFAASDEPSDSVTKSSHYENMLTLDFIIELNGKAIRLLEFLSKSKNKHVISAFNTLLDQVNLTGDSEYIHQCIANTIDTLHDHAEHEVEPIIKTSYFTSKIFFAMSATLFIMSIPYDFFYGYQNKKEGSPNIAPLLSIGTAGAICLSFSHARHTDELTHLSRAKQYDHSADSDESFFRNYTDFNQKEITSETRLTTSCIDNHTEIFTTGKKNALWLNFFGTEANNPLKEEVKKEYDALIMRSSL